MPQRDETTHDTETGDETSAPKLLDQLLELSPEINIGELQRKDKDLSPIIDALEADIENAKFSKEYVLDNAILYHIADPVRLDPEPRLQVALPSVLIPVVLETYHDKLGHYGIDKSYSHIRSRYFWPTMFRDVVKHVSSCVPCTSRNLRKRKVEIQDMPVPEYPFQMVGIDTCGPYPESFNGNRYMVTIVDWFSSWLECFPTKDHSAQTVARVILEEIIPRHGVMSTMTSDRGGEYVNEVVDMLSAELNILRKTTSVFHPASNGKCERSHKTINGIISKALENQDQRKWDEYIPSALLAYRVSVSDTNKMSPFFLIYGRDPLLPMDTLLGPKLRYMGDDYVPTMLSRLHKAFVVVKENMRAAREKNQRYFNQRADKCDYQVGDPVYYLDKATPPGLSTKLTLPWRPYYRIVEKLTPVSFKIRHQPSGKTKIVHAEHLRAANPTAAWDKIRTEYRAIGQKYRPIPEESTRTQPLRQSRLEMPQALGAPPAPTCVRLEQTPQDPLSGGAGSRPDPAHRYNLRPRPARPQPRVTGKRPGADLDPPEATQPKHFKSLTSIPMEIGAILLDYTMHPGIILALGILLGLVYMSLIAVLLH